MPPLPTDKFLITFPESDPPRVLKTLGRVLSLPYLQKNAPLGRQVTGLQDAQGRQWDVHGAVPGGAYTVVYEEEDEEAESLLHETTHAADVARAYMAAYHTPLSFQGPDASFPLLARARYDGQHDILALAEARVVAAMSPQRASWSYTLGFTPDSVLVALDCQALEGAFCEFTRTHEWTSGSGQQGQGAIHQWAYALAASLPFVTLLSLCTSDSHLFAWDALDAGPAPKRKLVFTGRGVGGMVAHVAALLARDTSLLGAHVEVRAVAFGAPPCVSSGIATVLAQSGLDQQHVTFFHEADVRLRLLHTAFAVQLCKLVGKDASFEELVSHTQALLGPQPDREAWAALLAMHGPHSGLRDMLDINRPSLEAQRFVPLGVFCRETSGRTLKSTGAPFDVEQWLEAIPLRFQRLQEPRLSPGLLLANAEFAPSTQEIKVVSEQLVPDIQQCLVEVYPPKGDLPPRLALKVTGLHLENLMQRDSMAVGLAVRGLGGAQAGCPLLIHDITAVDFDSSCTVAVTHHSLTEASLELNGISLRTAPLRMSLWNDFGESKPFTPSRVHTAEREKLKLQVFTTFNEDLLITAFMRSMMFLTCFPSCSTRVVSSSSYLSSSSSSPSTTDATTDAAATDAFTVLGESLPEIGGHRDERDQRELEAEENDEKGHEEMDKQQEQEKQQEQKKGMEPKKENQKEEAQQSSTPNRSSPPPHRLEDMQVPEVLTLLFEVEEFLLKRRSKLHQIAEEYCDKADRIHYAVCQARKVVGEIVQQLMTPLKLKYTNPALKLMKKVAGGIGIITGGVISIVGGALATPGTLLALAGTMGSHLDDEEPSRWSYPGLYLALPGMGLSAAGVWLARRSHAASKDQPTLQYASILKLILNILYDCSDRVIYEVPSLEDRIAHQARKQIANFAHSRPHLDGQELWTIADEDLDYVLTQFDEGSPACSGEYLHASFASRQTIRLWMRISGRIHRIRSQLESHLVIGFVGVHNAGKSTWINTLFDLGVMADSLKRTESIDPRPLLVSPSPAVRAQWAQKNPSSLQVTVVDYPGSSDQREDMALAAERLAQVTTLFVCVFRFGHVAKAEKQVVDMVKRSERDFVVLINQCDIAKDLEVRESEYRSNYAEVLEIEESRLQFVSSRRPERAEYVRHLLWLHLQILTPQAPDRIELAMKLLDADKKAHIADALDSLSLYHALVRPFERGTESGTALEGEEEGEWACEEGEADGEGAVQPSSWFPQSIFVLLVHNEVYEWLVEVGIPERDIEVVYRCLDAHFLPPDAALADLNNPQASQQRQSMVMHQHTLTWIQEELALLSNRLPGGEDLAHEPTGTGTLAWVMFSLASTLQGLVESLQDQALGITREWAIAALELSLKERRPLEHEALVQLAHSMAHAPVCPSSLSSYSVHSPGPSPSSSPKAPSLLYSHMSMSSPRLHGSTPTGTTPGQHHNHHPHSHSHSHSNQHQHQHHSHHRRSGVTVFKRNELIYNLALSTRLWPAPRMVLKPFDVYQGDFQGQNMPLLKRLKLFTSRLVKVKRPFSHFSHVSTIALRDDTALRPDAIASSVLAIQASDLRERKYKITGGTPSEYVSLALAAFHEGALLLEYEGGLYFNPCAPLPSPLMRALGRLIGIRLQEHHEAERSAFPLHLSLTLCKIILGEPLSFNDLEYLCPSLCKRIRYLCLLPPDDVEAQALTFMDELGDEVQGPLPSPPSPSAPLLPPSSSSASHTSSHASLLTPTHATSDHHHHLGTGPPREHEEDSHGPYEDYRPPSHTGSHGHHSNVEAELVPHGGSIGVCSGNLNEYLRALVFHRLGRHLSLDSFVVGVQDVIPREYLCVFSSQMLLLLVNGVPPKFSVEDLRRSSLANKGMSEDVQQWFWECVEAMKEEDAALFLIFVTGSPWLPPGGLKPNFMLKSVKGSLITSQRVNHVLQLPKFTSKEQLSHNLLLTVRKNSCPT